MGNFEANAIRSIRHQTDVSSHWLALHPFEYYRQLLVTIVYISLKLLVEVAIRE